MAERSVANGDFYKRIGGVALMTGTQAGLGMLVLETEKFVDGSIFTDLNFRFSFEYSTDKRQGVIGQGSVEILGLSSETIRQWASAAPPEENLKKKRFVRVFAGYQSEGKLSDCELLTIPYFGALPTTPPEMWLKFNCQNIAGGSNVLMKGTDLWCSGTFEPGAYNKRIRSNTVNSYQSSFGISIHDACKQMIDKFREDEERGFAVELEWHIGEEWEKRLPRLRYVDFSGQTLEAIVRTINSWGVVQASIEDREESIPVSESTEESVLKGIANLAIGLATMGAANAYDYANRAAGGDGILFDGDIHQKKLLRTYLVIKPLPGRIDQYDEEMKKKLPYRIAADNGMIGLPQFGEGRGTTSVTVKSLLRKDIHVGDLIEIESSVIPSPYRYYQVSKVRYEGEFRGQSWYVTYTGFGVIASETVRNERKERGEAAAAAARRTEQGWSEPARNAVKQGANSLAEKANDL